MSEAASENIQQTSQTSQENSFSIPEQYADRGWTKTIQSQEDLWKQFDNTQTLLGKRPAGIPVKDAPQEEWDKFYASLGRPETPDKYELSDKFEGLPDGTDLTESRKMAAELAHKIGLSPQQANALWEGYMGIELESLKGQEAQKAEKEAALDKEFDELGGKLFGDQFEAVMKEAQNYLKAVLPEELGDVSQELAGNPKALLAMIKIANHAQTQTNKIKKEYGAEDKLASGEQSAGITVNEINTKLADAKDRYTKAPVFSQQRKDIEQEIEGLRAQLRKAV